MWVTHSGCHRCEIFFKRLFTNPQERMTGQVADVSEVGLTERIANINIYMQEHMGLTLSIGNSDFIETKCTSQGGLLNRNSFLLQVSLLQF